MNESAFNEYVSLIWEIRDTAACICEWSDNHGDISPDEVNYSHVAAAQKVLNDLRDICRFANIEIKED